jgi:tripartite-type tricarboxylate transporter receptor subunit TctC
MIRRRALLAAALAAPLAAPLVVRAQGSFPNRRVTIIVPYPAGGGLDLLTRAIADHLQGVWGQPVVVENRPGGSTIPGADAVVRAAPDGHTLMLTADNTITSNPHLFRNLPHDPIRDLAPVTHLVDVHQMVVINAGLDVRDMAGLVAAARARPGQLNYGSFGPGSQPHLAFETLKAENSLDIVHITYRGLPMVIPALLSNEIQMTLSGIASAGQHIGTGRLRGLAVGRPTRFPTMPDVPTLAEAGFGSIDPRTWFGLFAPGATPAAIVAQIQQAVAAALRVPAIADRHLTPNGYTVHGSEPAAFAAFVREDLAYKERMIRVSGARVE